MSTNKKAKESEVVKLQAKGKSLPSIKPSKVNPAKYLEIKELKLSIKKLTKENNVLRLSNEKATYDLDKKLEIDNLNQILLDSLPHPAMYIRRSDRVVIAANKIALDFGVKPGGYCWREFGKSNYLSEKNKEIAAKFPEEVPSKFKLKCVFCQGDKCFTNNAEQNNPEVHLFGRIWNAYWIKASSGVFLHYVVDITQKKISEEALMRSENLLRNTQSLTLSGGWEWDIERKNMYWTDETYNIHDFHPTGKETLPLDLKELSLSCYLPEDRKVILEALNNCIEKGIPYDKEFRFNTLKGRKIWIRTQAQPFYRDGKIEKVIGVIIDITSRKQTIENLKELNEQFETLATLSPVGIYLTDAEGECIYANPAWCSMAGLSSKEALGLGWLNGLHPEDRKMVFNNWKRMVESHGEWGFEYRFQNKTGKVTQVYGLATPQCDEEENVVRYIGVNLDITERKLAEQILIDSEMRLASLVNILQNKTNSIQELLDFTLDEAIKLTNSKIGYIYFYSEEKMEFTLFSWSKQVMKDCSIVNPETVYNLEETSIWGEAVRHRKPIMVNDFQAANPLKKGFPEGHAALYKYLTIPVFVGKEIVAVVGVANKGIDYVETDILHLTLLMDFTWKAYERMKLAEVMQNQNDELIKLNADKDKFMSILAHDLKSPFSGLLGLSEVLTSNIRNYDIEKIENMTSLIHTSAKTTYNLMEALLLWTRTQSGKIPFDPIEINLYEICKEVILDLNVNAEGKSIAVNNLIDRKLNAYADSDMLKTILRNLISNAIKFTNSKGKIDISCIKNEKEISISVTDNGIGISPELTDKMFDLSQLNSTKGTANETGTGLGLLLCKDFVSKHGGKIMVESQLGVGSEFKFSLPNKAKKNIF